MMAATTKLLMTCSVSDQTLRFGGYILYSLQITKENQMLHRIKSWVRSLVAGPEQPLVVGEPITPIVFITPPVVKQAPAQEHMPVKPAKPPKPKKVPVQKEQTATVEKLVKADLPAKPRAVKKRKSVDTAGN
jgi:hypothetical protein